MLGNIFKIQTGTKKMVLAMLFVAVFIILGAFFYYHKINLAEDPRILESKRSYSKLQDLIGENLFQDALFLLDTIEKNYQQIEEYHDSFELGVIYNDRASIYLIMAETEYLKFKDSENLKRAYLDSLLKKARVNIDQSIRIYRRWLNLINSISDQAIGEKVASSFQKSRSAFDGFDLMEIIAKRTKEIILSRLETPRRLSVALTNLGIIERYDGNIGKSEKCYNDAIQLWEENHVAKNNLNILKGRPMEKRGILKSLFPPKKNEN